MALTTESTMLKKLRAKFIGLICGVAALILSASFAYIAWSAQDQEVKSVYIELGNATESVFDKKPHDSWGGGFDALNTGASILANEYIYTKYGNKSKLAYGSI